MVTGEDLANNKNELHFPDLRLIVMTPRPEHISSNFAVLKAVDRAKRQLSINDKDMEREQKRLALETAMLVQQEVEHWEASIRELESLLQQQESAVDKGNAEEVEAVALNEETVPVVVDDEEEDEELTSPSFGISSSPSTPVDKIPSQ
jgi:hypothetical protein